VENRINSAERILASWQQGLADRLPDLALAVVLFAGFYLLARAAKAFSLHFYTKVYKGPKEVPLVIGNLVYFFLLLSGAYVALRVLHLEAMLSHLLAGAGVLGIIAGFAFKDIASNVFAGLLLRMQRPFAEGDWVDIDGAYGVVDAMGWLTTTIRTVPGQDAFVPNQIIYSATFTNYSVQQKRRVILQTGVSYGDDLEKVKAATLDEMRKLHDVLPNEDIDFYFTDIGASSYDFQIRFWITFHDNNDYQRAMSDAIVALKRRFAAEGFSIPYSVTTMDFGVKGGVNLFDKEVKVAR